MKRLFLTLLLGVGLSFILSGCMNANKNIGTAGVESTAGSLFILNEGNFNYGNGTVSIYNPKKKELQNEAFFKTNGMKVGDVVQSMKMHNSLGWIVVNNSKVIFAVDNYSLKEKGRITGFTSPRYIHFVSTSKAYVTQLWDPRIAIVDPQRYIITGYIETGMQPQAASTEQMVQVGNYVYVTCWSYQDEVLKIDVNTDEIVARLKVGKQPSSIVVDKNEKIWVLTDGGGSTGTNEEYPKLVRINPTDFSIERTFEMNIYEHPHSLALNRYKDHLFWITGEGLWKMPISDDKLPVLQFIENHKTNWYGLTIDPTSDEIYAADALDYNQPGRVYRYNANGTKVDQFNVGVNPSAFCWAN